MYAPEDALQAFRSTGSEDQVHVVGHQAIGENLDFVLPCAGMQHSAVEVAIRVIEEHRLAAIATLGHVERDVGDHLAGESRHEKRRRSGRVD